MRRDYTVYILQCADGSYYTGITNNVIARVEEHQRGINEHCYTLKRRPVSLVHSESFRDVRAAIRWEKILKGWRREKKEALINGEYEKIPKLSECQNQTHCKFFRGCGSTELVQSWSEGLSMTSDLDMESLRSAQASEWAPGP
ncbi:GIY-YIG nuclease family protein [Candidatus Peregrinibacteria bacterium]|nr:GIY-YIG nuclease family protein [Candidatus Peregrinibacteria bacterium]